jgi:hypothetical protein
VDVGTDAYVSAAEVTAYLTARGQVTAWAASTDAQKEAAIIEATSFLDAAFSWVGKLEDCDQPLGWPRICAKDREGRTLTDIPIAVKNACCELANLALGGRLMPMTVSTGSFAVKRDKIGDTETEYDTTQYEGSYNYVRMILRGIGSLSGTGIGMSKLVRS